MRQDANSVCRIEEARFNGKPAFVQRARPEVTRDCQKMRIAKDG